jgi:hypothetical protein
MKHGRALVLAAALALPAPARADAPALSMQAAHKAAQAALNDVVQKLAAADRQKIVGAYVAFNADPKDALALAACDDDGDYVVLVSDGLLVLVDAVARAEATDEMFKTQKLGAYAAHLAKEQRPGERLLAPPAGFYEPAHATREAQDLQSKKLRDLLAQLVAHEIAEMIAGNVVCPAPTATHERGDDTWTAQEHAAALAAAPKIYDARRVTTADAVGTGYALEAGATEEPIAAFFTPFLAAIEASARAKEAFGYVRFHPGAIVRAQVVRTAASSWRKAHPP